VTDIEPDAKVRTAMNEINAAVRFRAAALEKAEAEKIMVVKKAEANAEAKYLEGATLLGTHHVIVCLHNGCYKAEREGKH
jgi:hemin uptake protein HemP